jgi:hypothetical protein
MRKKKKSAYLARHVLTLLYTFSTSPANSIGLKPFKLLLTCAMLQRPQNSYINQMRKMI